MYTAIDVDSDELLTLEASYGRSSINAHIHKVLKQCINKSKVVRTMAFMCFKTWISYEHKRLE